MKVIVPYANNISDPEIHYVVRLNLDILGIDAEWVRLDEPNSYALLVNRLWDEGAPFVIVEHDVIPWRGAVEELWECEHPNCTYDGTLQTAKITPDGPCPVDPRSVWFHVDVQMWGWRRPHEHCPARPPVTNLNRHNIPVR